MEDLKCVLAGADILERVRDDAEALERENPHGYRKLLRLWNLYQRTLNRPPGDAKKIVGRWLQKTAGPSFIERQAYEAFQAATITVKGFLAELIREFIPESLRFPFTSDGVSMPTSDPAELLHLIWDPPGDPEFSRLRAFEAGLFWHLGMRYLLMRLKTQPLESYLREFTLWLEQDLFVDGHGQKRGGYVTAFYDPSDDNHYSEADTGHQLTQQVSYRFIRTGRRHYIKVLYESRVKQENDAFRKSLVKNMADQPVINDYCACTIVVFSIDDLNILRQLLRERIFVNGDAITNAKLNGIGGKPNPYTSGISPPEEQFVAFVYGGQIEVQIFLYPNYFNRHFSTGPENHHLYRLNQVWPLFSLFFPTELYLIDWNDKTLQRLRALQLGRIRANLEAHTTTIT